MAVNRIINLMQVMRLLKRIRPDVLHAHFITYYGTLGALTGYHPFVVTAWGSDILIMPKRSRRAKWVAKYVIKRADLITCDAEHIRERLIELGAEAQKIILINFGIDTEKFKPLKSKKLQKKLNTLESPIVISLRNLEPIYDVKSLILSAPLVLKECPEARFIIAGRGSQEAKLRKLASSLGISDSVKFVGFIPNEKLPEYLASADVYVSTSLSDAGLAASTAEAMACGLPVIVTDFGDNRRWVKNGVNGFIVPLRDPKTLADKIVYLLKNENIRKEFGIRNRIIIEKKNNYYKEMERMKHIYEVLAGRRGS